GRLVGPAEAGLSGAPSSHWTLPGGRVYGTGERLEVEADTRSKRGSNARRNGRHLSGRGRGTNRSQRLPERASPRRPRQASRVRLAVGRRASLHRLHDVSRRPALPDVFRRAHGTHPARLDGGGAALAPPLAGR